MDSKMIVAICSTKNWYFYVATELYALFKHNEVSKVYLFIENDEIPYLKDKIKNEEKRAGFMYLHSF